MMQRGRFDKSGEQNSFRYRPRCSAAFHSSLRHLCHRLRFARRDVMRESVGNWPGAHSWARKSGRQSLRKHLSGIAPAAAPHPMCRRVVALRSEVRFSNLHVNVAVKNSAKVVESFLEEPLAYSRLTLLPPTSGRHVI